MPLLVLLLTYQSIQHDSWTTTAALFLIWILLLIIIPLWHISNKISLGQIKDWDMRSRRERLLAAPIFLASTASALFLTQFFSHPDTTYLLLFLWITTALTTIITYFWKISLHAVINTTGIIIINIMFSWQFSWLFLLLAPVAWARYSQRHHTLHQILAGSSLVMAITLVML